MLTAPLIATSLLYTLHGWRPCSTIGRSAHILGVDRHGKLVFEPVSLRSVERLAKAVFLGTARSCGTFAYTSCIQDSRGERWAASRVVNEMAIADLRFEITSGLPTDITLLGEDSNAIWNSLSCEGITKRDDIWIRARRPTDDSPLPKHTEAWHFERIDSRIYGAVRKAFLDPQPGNDKFTDFIEGLLYIFRNEDGVCEFSRNTSLIPMIIADYCVRTRRQFTMHFDSLQHTAIVYVAIDRADTHALARGLCACILPEPSLEEEVTWTTPSWNPISGGLILSARRS